MEKSNGIHNREEEIKELKRLQKKQNRKTSAKAAGLKSVLLTDKKTVLTSFGKGNDSIVEKIIEEKKIKDVADTKHYDARIIETKTRNTNKEELGIDGRLIKDAKSDLPKSVRKDQLGAKDKLEEIFFGEQFPQDNIRIQMLYNVLDIEKEYSRHIVNALYGINHLNRNIQGGRNEKNDYVGNIFASDKMSKIKSEDAKQKEGNKIPHNGTKYDRFLNYYKGAIDETDGKRKDGARDYLIYYGEAFDDAITELQSQRPDYQIAEELVYDRLCILSLLRQGVAHGEGGFETDIVLAPDAVLKSEKHSRLQSLLKKDYLKRVKGIDDDFIKNNKNRNLPIIFNIYNAVSEKEKKTLSIEFYKYVVLKENKNMGFSLKKLREMLLLKPEFVFMKNEEYDTARGKMYSIVDFVIYKYYAMQNANAKEIGIVERLRGTKSKSEKEAIYKEEAAHLAENIKGTLSTKNMSSFKSNEIKDIKGDDTVKENWLNGEKISDKEVSNFTLLANFMSMFLDGKEINEFLSILINKLESIAALKEVINNETISPKKDNKKEKTYSGFEALAAALATNDISIKEEFEWLKNAGEIATEIRILKNVARMKFADDLNFKRPMYCDAVNVLSNNKSAEALSEFIDEEMLSKNVKEKNLRNFISNNVIKSRRFKYLMRYSNPSIVRKLMQDENLIEFVLKRIDNNNPEQLEKYMNSIHEAGEDRVAVLTRKLLALRFEDLFDIKQKVRTGSNEAVKKETYKAVLGLYLTVAYIAIKNLVNINSRYVMAFSALERDSSIFLSRYDKEQPLKLLDKKLGEGAINRRYAQIFKENERNVIENAFRIYRNNVAHLTVVEKLPNYLGKGEGQKREILSYFELYHFILQNLINSECKSREKHPGSNLVYSNTQLANEIQKISNYRSYNKDALNILNTPFGYSLARYKALTVEALFDKNYPEERLKMLGECDND